MAKKPDYQLEYVYTRDQFRKTLWWCLGIYIALRIARAVLYLTVGITVLSSIPAAFIFFFSGFVLGILALAIYRYRTSVKIEDLEREKDRLSQE